ncbi:MAG: hypothetical protein J0H42_24190 [Rhizobiales bacterium]|nr:hypothetical protein [Hyphomicrobiales bacterium]
MSVEWNEDRGESRQSGPGLCGCGSDSEQAAKTEIEKAQREIGRAEKEIEHGIRDLNEARIHLDKAERDLEREHHEEGVHFTVDGEPFETRHPEQTPNFIIKEYSDRDPATNYLVKIQGHGKDVSYKDKGNTQITIEDCDAFQIISVGPAPVSDGRSKTGVDAFIAGLQDVGCKPEIVPNKSDHVAFTYEVPTGKYAGQSINIGLVVPPDFPLTPPGGVHISSLIHPNKPGGSHPTGGVHDSSFQGYLGHSWQYWSRPFNEWSKTKRTITAYFGHLWKLWDTQ